ncbi:MAG: alpha/beta hydrolase-fold protein, partial [Candidatus Neomarinimicrobiota bacterium]
MAPAADQLLSQRHFAGANYRARMYDRPLHGEVRYLELDSELLKDNPLGDPHVRRFPVYLPPGYDEDSRHYPVIFALAGFTGTGQNMAGYSVWEENLPEQMDDLVASETAPATIVAMPDCFTRLGGSQYVNSTATGPYADYLVQEVVPFVDRELRTLAEGDHRGVMGKSSGGYGALTLAMKHPGLFSAVACHSGDMYFEYGYMRDFPAAVNALNDAGSVDGFLQTFAETRRKGPLIPALNIIAMAAAYSPKDAAIELPFELPSGRLRLRVWERWLTHDPIRLIEEKAYAEALRGLKQLFLDAGVRDEYGLHLG